MLTLRKVAVTGGIASGKSTVCHFFRNLGAYVVSADAITHQLLSSNQLLKQQVVSLLGTKVLREGQIDRAAVARIVFDNPNLLGQLEQLIHPLVNAQITKEWQEQLKKQASLFVVEMPLLFETQDSTWYDSIITVTAPQEICKERFFTATGSSSEEYNRRAVRQLSPEKKEALSTIIIKNDSTKEHLEQMVKTIYQTLIK